MSFTNRQIREKAYELWKARGSRQGFAMQDWADAEKLLSQMHVPATSAATATIADEPAPKASAKAKSKTASNPAPAQPAYQRRCRRR